MQVCQLVLRKWMQNGRRLTKVYSSKAHKTKDPSFQPKGQARIQKGTAYRRGLYQVEKTWDKFPESPRNVKGPRHVM